MDDVEFAIAVQMVPSEALARGGRVAAAVRCAPWVEVKFFTKQPSRPAKAALWECNPHTSA